MIMPLYESVSGIYSMSGLCLQVLLFMQLCLHIVHLCGRAKPLYIIIWDPRKQVDITPAHQCQPKVLHTIL